MLTTTTTSDHDQLANAIDCMRLRAPVGDVSNLLGSFPETQHGNLRKLLLKLGKLEADERDARNLKRRTREACLPPFPTLDKFDWNHPRKIPRALYASLLENGYVRNAENVLLRGPSGVGKTTLAANLAWAAIQAGYRVRYSTLSEALADLLRQESLPAFERRKRKYSTPDLLVLDELGYVPCDTRSADILYAIIASRHEKAATVITTNLSFKNWPDIFPGAACVGALVDRFVQHCHIIDIEADSWRHKIAKERQRKAATATKSGPSKSTTKRRTRE